MILSHLNSCMKSENSHVITHNRLSCVKVCNFVARWTLKISLHFLLGFENILVKIFMILRLKIQKERGITNFNLM